MKVGTAFACCFQKWFVAFGVAAEEGLEGMSCVEALMWLSELMKKKVTEAAKVNGPVAMRAFSVRPQV